MNVNAPQPAKQALPPSEQDCRLIVDSIPGHVVTLTAHGDIEFVNQQWLDYLGKTIDEVKSELKCWTNGVVHPDDLSRLVATWSRSVETGQPYDYECRFCRADGVFRWFHVRAIPERDAEGRIVRWYSLRTDIDERKQAEDRLQLLLNVTNQEKKTFRCWSNTFAASSCERADQPLETNSQACCPRERDD